MALAITHHISEQTSIDKNKWMQTTEAKNQDLASLSMKW
jgi:hypothetical protein